MNEMEAAKRIAEGSLPSPYKHENMTLWAIRITGVGMAYRDSLEEYVWRDPDIFLAPEFVERVHGLPVILEHPKVGSLNSEEFHDRVIGTCMFGYVKEDAQEVWAIARLYDDEAIELMSRDQLSTSPGVVFGPKDGNVRKTTTDGDVLLIEASPSTLCHICVTSLGVWDKGGPPLGIQNDLLSTENGEIGMAEHEEKGDADKSRHDAEMMDKKLDAIMDAFSKMDARLDSFEKEKKDKARHDAARKDKFGHRKDGEKFHDWSKRHDADEEAMADAMRKDGGDEKDCMDAAKKARHDAEEEEKRHDKDFEKWAKEEEKEPEHKEDKKDAKHDAEGAEDSKKDAKKHDSEEEKEEEEEKSDSRKDSAMSRENEELKARLAKLEGIVKGVTAETPGAERDALARSQARADSVMAMLGDRSSPPIPGETDLAYRKRLLKRLAPHSPQFKDSSFTALDSATITVVEDRVYADAANSARAVGDATPGMLVPFEERDRAGRVITKYHGDIGAMLAPFTNNGEGISGRFIRKGNN